MNPQINAKSEVRSPSHAEGRSQKWESFSDFRLAPSDFRFPPSYRILRPMQWEGKRFLPETTGYALLLKCDRPLTPLEITILQQEAGVRVFSLAAKFRFERITWKEVYDRFKASLSGIADTEGAILAYDLPDESPLNLLANIFIRRWLKSACRKGWRILPGLYIRQENERVLRIAKPVPQEWIDRVNNLDKLRRFLVTKLRFMDSALELTHFYLENQEEDKHEPLADPQDPDVVAAEMAALDPAQCLCRQSEFEVWLAHPPQIPTTLKEIGRLREKTFRTVKEGTGMALDVDEYDLYYDQLIIWDAEAKCIVGGYRIGRGDTIFQTYGAQGFYIHSLFNIDEEFYTIFPQALELGRSYIIEEYQRKRLPLFLLWKGILYFLLQNPGYRYLYGPVSISNYYSSISHSLIIYFIKKHFFDKKLARYLTPRKKFKYSVDKKQLELMTRDMKGDLDQLNSLIEDIEPSHFKIPVLLRQYIRQNARFIAFNVDPKFSNALDGFIILDLLDVPAETMEALQKEIAAQE
jgi:hypothetical protein